MPFCRTNDVAAREYGWFAHTPQPDDPPPTEPGEPDAPPIGDPPPEPGEVPHTVSGDAGRRCATRAPAPAGRHVFCVFVTRRSTFLPAVRRLEHPISNTPPHGGGLPLEGSR